MHPRILLGLRCARFGDWRGRRCPGVSVRGAAMLQSDRRWGVAGDLRGGCGGRGG